MNSNPDKRPLGTRWCQIGMFLAVAAGVLTLIGLGGGRTGLLAGVPAFMAFGIGALLFMVSVLVSLVGLALSKGTAGAASAGGTVAAIAIGILVIGAAMSQRPDSADAPPIHDLTTDTTNPPEFVAVVALRTDAPNPPEYLDNGTAEKQQAAFPELTTLVTDMPAPQVFAAAEATVGELGWELVEADLLDGRIEATDTTYWFGFKDDVVIRIAGDGTRTYVDVRSKSRVGMGDMGTNARRIQGFLAALAVKTGA